MNSITNTAKSIGNSMNNGVKQAGQFLNNNKGKIIAGGLAAGTLYGAGKAVKTSADIVTGEQGQNSN